MKRSNIWKAVFGAVCLGGLCAACTTRPEIHITGSVRHADGALLVAGGRLAECSIRRRWIR